MCLSLSIDTTVQDIPHNCNMGLKRMAGVDASITAEDLRYTRRRYLHKEHMRAAIAQVVNALLHTRLEAIWGEATSTCASDSKKFHAVDQNLLTQWHARYRGPGVLVYWHVERRSVCIYSQLKSCTSRRAWRRCSKECCAIVLTCRSSSR